VTDDLSHFCVPYERTEDSLHDRAMSWKYQREIMKATPRPKHLIEVRFEDFVLRQDQTLAQLEDFLGISLAKIEVNRDAVGRWKRTDQSIHFDFLRDDIIELGYDLECGDSSPLSPETAP
jgi:hypothetical protein